MLDGCVANGRAPLTISKEIQNPYRLDITHGVLWKTEVLLVLWNFPARDGGMDVKRRV
jgi:hypothetical protein